MTPVFFGSALRHFGVDQLLEGISAYAPPPTAVAAARSGPPNYVALGAREVYAFLFQVQANMYPTHRDRIAFLTRLSGTFSRGSNLDVQKHRKHIHEKSPTQ